MYVFLKLLTFVILFANFILEKIRNTVILETTMRKIKAFIYIQNVGKTTCVRKINWYKFFLAFRENLTSYTTIYWITLFVSYILAKNSWRYKQLLCNSVKTIVLKDLIQILMAHIIMQSTDPHACSLRHKYVSSQKYTLIIQCNRDHFI